MTLFSNLCIPEIGVCLSNTTKGVRELIMHCPIELTGLGEHKPSQGREYYEALAASLGVSIEAMANQTLH